MLPHVRRRANLVIDPKTPGLLAGYQFKPNGDIFPDVKGLNDGTCLGPAYNGDAFGSKLLFDTSGESPYVVLGNNSSFKRDHFTVSMWARPYFTTTTKGMLSSSAAHWYVGVSSSQRLVFSNARAAGTQVVDYTSDNAVRFDLINHFVFTVLVENLNVYKRIYVNGTLKGSADRTDGWGATYGSNFIIGGFSPSSLLYPGEIYQLAFLDHAVDLVWVDREYRKGLAAHWRSGPVGLVSGVTDGNLGNSSFRVLSGSFSVVAVGDNVVIECVSPGKFYLPACCFDCPTQSAYGDFEWYWSQGSAGNTTRLDFVSSDLSGTDGYGMYIGSSGQLALDRLGVGDLFVTDTGYCTAGTVYKQRINRKYDGAFTSYTDDTQTPVTTGTNPVTDNNDTTSLFVVGDFDVGDRLYLGEALSFKKRVLP